ncbi:MAG: RcpC/CpaB family pilus assembly protein, partial [Anaerolineae bacterium]
DMMLSPQEAMMEGELGKLVEVGKIAVAFPIDELSSVSYGVKPGDYVDLLITFSFVDIDQETQIQEPLCPIECPGVVTGEEGGTVFEAAAQIPRLVSQLTVQDAAILGVGRWLEQPVSTEEQQRQEEEGEAPQPKVPEYVTLMVTPQDALVLKLAREYGASIDLAVRAQDDHQAFVTEQVTLDYVLARFGVSLPGKQPYTIENMRTLQPQPQENE